MGIKRIASDAARCLGESLSNKQILYAVGCPARILHVSFKTPYGINSLAHEEFVDVHLRPAMEALVRKIKGKIVWFHKLDLPRLSPRCGSFGKNGKIYVRVMKQYNIRWDEYVFRFDIGISTFTKKGTLRKGNH